MLSSESEHLVIVLWSKNFLLSIRGHTRHFFLAQEGPEQVFVHYISGKNGVKIAYVDIFDSIWIR